MQMTLPDPFDEGPVEERLKRLSAWAGNVHPGRQFSAREIGRITGIPHQTITHIMHRALDKISPKLEKIKHEYTK